MVNQALCRDVPEITPPALLPVSMQARNRMFENASLTIQIHRVNTTKQHLNPRIFTLTRTPEVFINICKPTLDTRSDIISSTLILCSFHYFDIFAYCSLLPSVAIYTPWLVAVLLAFDNVHLMELRVLAWRDLLIVAMRSWRPNVKRSIAPSINFL